MILNLVYECWRVKANFGPIRVLFQAFPFRQSSLLLSIPSTAATQRKTLVNNWLCSLLSERPKSMLYFTALINGLRKNKREQPIKAIMLHAIICSKSRRTKCAFWCFLMTSLNCRTRQAFLFKNSVVSFANFLFQEISMSTKIPKKDLDSVLNSLVLGTRCLRVLTNQPKGPVREESVFFVNDQHFQPDFFK